jgi:hypothetical protein
MDSIATLPSVVTIEIHTLIDRIAIGDDRSHIDRIHDRQWLESFFQFESDIMVSLIAA